MNRRSRISALALSLAFLSLSSARAEDWVKKLDCGDSHLVVDEAISSERGVVEHQLVIRDPRILLGLTSLVGAPLPLNDRQELVLKLGSHGFRGDFSVVLLDQKLNPGLERAFLNGHWIGEGRYEIYVTSGNAGPGWSERPHYVGNWVLSGCRWAR